MMPARLNRLVRHTAMCSVLCLTAVSPSAAQNWPSVIVQEQRGQLTYATDARGNRVPDFSSCGYAAQAQPIPTAPVRVVVEARSGDSTTRIQRALDHVGSLPPDQDGLRGAVLLFQGRHEVLGGLRITNSGVVLRGQGVGEGGTTLVAVGLDRRTLIRIKGGSDRPEEANPDWQVADTYVPVGAPRFRLRNTRGLQIGNTVKITRPSTREWIERLGATEFGGGVGGGWKPGSRDIVWNRIVVGIDGEAVTLNAPITTAIESEFGGAHLATYSWVDNLSEVGVENLRLESAFDANNPKDENHSWCAITIENARDSWVRQVTFKHFAGSAVALHDTAQRITVQDCLALAPVSENGGYRRHTFFTMGQQTLFLRCYAELGRHDFAAGHGAAGPNAFVQCEAREPLADSGPIESWASGILYDNVVIDGHALTFGFRPGNNAGIGWAAANCVLWNCSASVIRCWNPPGARNWSFGSWASFEGDGIWRGSNTRMEPTSLFAAQLKGRLDADAVRRLKLMPRPREGSSNPTLEQAQELAAASHQAAPQLRDYILSASQRDPIPCEPGGAQRVEDISSRSSRGNEAQTSNRRSRQSLLTSAAPQLTITNGWLVADGQLLIGGTAGVAWWRGNIRPDEAAGFGLGITRFVPGQIGPGLTDDLNEVATAMETNGLVALDHHYGLWYERRRDDHERTRRIDGDVLPPFFEQPFARSGQGIAWDGLSQYDLTQFNPWYWSRLREFADLCDQRGLVLFHQHYFQHNVLEAGAHWADFPWRTANNINATGFPEPPPYAGDKRIFQAELFYDITHPIRRPLHEGYIRQCLDNFATNANVIHFTSAEFTGPLHFMQFWLDTIAEWQSTRSRRRKEALTPSAIGNRQSAIDQSLLTSAATKPIIALSATKDVQDAILADANRSATVDLIDFRYWWRTDKGEFAPPGGKNLAPRQFERQWRGGKPNDANLAGMAAEYRAKFPTKPLICDFESAGWAWVCAGGSLPRLPKTTDARLLSASPHMTPWTEASKNGRWVLREPGQQMLVFGGGELDLSGETGAFRLNTINPRTGQVTPSEAIEAGGTVKLPSATIIWLTKE